MPEAVRPSVIESLPSAHFLRVGLAGGCAEIRVLVRAASGAPGARVDLANNAGVQPVGLTRDLADAEPDGLLLVNARPRVLIGELVPAMLERVDGHAGSGSLPWPPGRH